MPAVLTQEVFIQKAREAHGDKYDYSKVVYVKNSKPVLIGCPVHGDFIQHPRDHLSQYNGKARGCNKCRSNCGINEYEWIARAKEIHGDKYDYSQVIYTGSKAKVIIRCIKHNISFAQQATSHIGTKIHCGCPKCGIEKRSKSRAKDTNYFIEKAQSVHDNKYDYSQVIYANRATPVKIICSAHGEFMQAPFNHYQGKGCSRCQTSQGETKVAKYLDSLNIQYEQQKKFEDCRNIFQLPFDFYLPEYNALIEYDGIQHFEARDIFGGIEGLRKTQINDDIKNKFARDSEKTLLRIKFDKNIELSIDLFIIGLD